MNDKTYQESKIIENIAACKNYIYKLYMLKSQLHYFNHEEAPEINEEVDQLNFEFNSKIRKTYLLVLAYLQSKGSLELLKLFQQELGQILSGNTQNIKGEYIDEIGEVYYFSRPLEKLEEFLLPFPEFDKDYIKSFGLIYLENILSNTGVILKDLKVKPKSETEVYKRVKFITKSIFVDSAFPSEPFYKTAKCYIPDILIPSLNTAVEYKYVDDEKKLITTIEQILADVKGYSNHSIFKIFYAVFYVKAGIFSEKRFKIIWEEFGFPNNWKPIFVSGE